jgi:TonB-linked SusC/RagA family outer membrane protein
LRKKARLAVSSSPLKEIVTIKMNMYKTYTEDFYSPRGYLSKLLVMMISAFSGISAADKRKWLMRANLTAFLIVLSLLQVSAASLAQKVTLKENNVSLEKVFREIRKQTGYDVLVDNTNFKTSKKINVNFVDTPLEKVMDYVVSGTGLTYVFEDKTVVIKEKSIVDKVVAYFANIDVTGRVVDEKGNGLAGANVKVKGTNTSASTDVEGKFLLRNVADDAILEITYLGYRIKEVKAVKEMGSIKLDLTVGKLEEVEINAGYYTVKDRERTGNISKVTAEEISKQPVNNPLMALVGKVPGLQIIQSTGVPGGGFTVRIRGQNSIASGNDPLYIVDGVNYPSGGISSTSVSSGMNNIFGTGGPNPLSLVNANDIESIEILKDADATAIYGSRGANGVILITTKRGKQGDAKINASISQGFSQVGYKIDLLNTEEYLQMRREAYFGNDKLTTASPVYATQYDINGAWEENKYTNWQDKLIGGTAPLMNAALNLSGGTLKNSYLIAANYSSEGTVIPGDFGVKRVGLRSNINLGAIEDRFQASLTINLNHQRSNLYSNLLMGYVFLPPNQPDVYDENGQINWANNTVTSNPMAELLRTSNFKTDNVITNLTLNYRLVNNLIFKTSLGYSTVRRREFRTSPLSSVAPSIGSTSTSRTSFFGNNYNDNFIAEPQLNYQKQIAKGKIDVLIGSSIQENNAQINVLRGSNFNSDELMGNIASAATITSDQNEFVQYRYFAVFGRFNYSLAEKYYLNFTARRDGSSRFGPGKQFANFGAVGAAWIFSEENNIKENLPFLTFGKLRGSYGITGNDQILNYQYLQLWNSGAVYQGSSTLIPSATAKNPLFSWETNRKIEAALEMRFFNDKLSLAASWFRNRSSDQLLYQPLPLSSGQSGSYINLPAEIQNTGWEFDVSIDILKRQDWKWSVDLNIAIPKNTLLSYDNLEISGNQTLYKIGEPINIIKVYHASIDKQTGSYVIEDINGNSRIDNDDRYLIKFLGQKSYGGLQTSLKYKQFSFDISFAFAKQNGRNPMANTISPGSYSPGTNSNQYKEVLNRWQNQGDESLVAKYSTTSTSTSLYSLNISQLSDRLTVNASYVRLRNISLSYSLPKTLLARLKINNASIYLQGLNLYTWTNYKGFDPETQGTTLPPLRTILAGFNVTF